MRAFYKGLEVFGLLCSVRARCQARTWSSQKVAYSKVLGFRV